VAWFGGGGGRAAAPHQAEAEVARLVRAAEAARAARMMPQRRPRADGRPRCKDGSLDMRCKVNRGLNKHTD
jgi:hypothetical protein